MQAQDQQASRSSDEEKAQGADLTSRLPRWAQLLIELRKEAQDAQGQAQLAKELTKPRKLQSTEKSSANGC